MILAYYRDVTGATSGFELLLTQVFLQQLFQANNRDNIKVSYYRAFAWWVFTHNGPVKRTRFHVMTLSWYD